MARKKAQSKKRSIVEAELLRLKNRKGVIKPEKVVEVAESPTSPLHGYFTWDDDKASYQWRLTEARELLRSFRIVREADVEATPVFVSLLMDRSTGGYRETSEVLRSADLTAELQRTAVEELETWSRRHAMLTGLVKSVMDAATKAVGSKISVRKTGRVRPMVRQKAG